MIVGFVLVTAGIVSMGIVIVWLVTGPWAWLANLITVFVVLSFVSMIWSMIKETKAIFDSWRTQ